MTLSGPAELADAGALEVTLEWDPTVAEIVAILAGALAHGCRGPPTRVSTPTAGPGRVRVGLGSPTGVVGLPSGELARVHRPRPRPGEDAFPDVGGAGYGKTGALRPEADGVALSVAP